jgi:hypothetical protein
MRKHKLLLTTALIFFLLVNTTYYWEGMLGAWAMLAGIGLFLTFVILVVALLRQTYLICKEQGKQRSRFYLIGILTTVLATSAFLPGLINPEQFEAEDLLIAQRPGVAACSTLLKLKADNTFYIREICFGVDKITGTYTIRKDTIMFHCQRMRDTNKTFAFGLLKPGILPNNTGLGDILLYKNSKDTLPNILAVRKNELVKK